VRLVRRSARRKLFVYRTNTTMSHVSLAKVSPVSVKLSRVCRLNLQH